MLVCPGMRLPAARHSRHQAPGTDRAVDFGSEELSDLPGSRIWITKTPRQKSQSCQIAVLKTNEVGKEDKRKGIN